MTITDIKKAHVYATAKYMIYGMIGIIFLQVIIYVLAPPPDTVIGMFELFEAKPFLGLLSLDLLYLLNNALLIMVYFSITLYLMSYKPLMALLALLVGAIGIASYYASNPAFEFLFLSQGFSLASALEKERLLANGELLLAGYIGTAFISYYILNAIALYIYSIALLLAKDVKKRVGVLGLISAVLMSIPSSFGTLGMVFALGSLIPWIIFCFMIAQMFHQKIKSTSLKE
ncbi:MAG: hypothetical protein RBQ71_03170 [Acholeplasmataceae bacterium]|jgi:hypothetical protein|nr:hypothetical protein [Acholeplasmataceae bacterium]